MSTIYPVRYDVWLVLLRMNPGNGTTPYIIAAVSSNGRDYTINGIDFTMGDYELSRHEWGAMEDTVNLKVHTPNYALLQELTGTPPENLELLVMHFDGHIQNPDINDMEEYYHGFGTSYPKLGIEAEIRFSSVRSNTVPHLTIRAFQKGTDLVVATPQGRPHVVASLPFTLD